ncbi:MAG: aspartate carbamoyltransferase [Candidatus Hadarchaeaceae archaeon]
MKGRDIISAFDFTREEFMRLFNEAKICERERNLRIAEDKMAITVFLEPSTRTRLSFTAAMLKIGGKVMDFGSIEASALMKGESFEDTIKMIDGYDPDVIIIRHKVEGSAKMAADIAENPVINGGDGMHEHPTQALLDLYTMYKTFGKIDGLRIALLGDLKHGRTLSSLSYALSIFNNVKLYCIAPPILQMRPEVIEKIKDKMPCKFYNSLDELDEEIDVLYVTRVQKERFTDLQEYERVKNSYIVTPSLLSKLKKIPIVMHPLPRVNEITTDVDTMPQAKYFEQATNGMYIRMALLAEVMGLRIKSD